MPERIAVDLSEEAVAALDEAIAKGRFRDRSHALDEAIREFLRFDSQEDVEAVRRSYAEHPESEVYGDAGLRLLADRLQDEEAR